MKTYQLLLVFLLVISCSKDQPCDGNCNANQICVNGVCECKEGYVGPNCSELFQPKDMTITQVKLTRFPGTKPNGSVWDVLNNYPGSNADLYFTITINDTSQIFISDVINNASAASEQSWSNLNIVLEEPVRAYTFGLYDYDAIGGNTIDVMTFIPYVYSAASPLTFIAVGDDKIDLLIDVTYNW